MRIACWEDFVLSEGTVTYLAARAIEAVDARVDAAERDRNVWARDVNLKVWLAILGAGLSIAIGFIVRAF